MPTTLAYEFDADHYASLLKHNQQRLMRQRSSMTRRVAYQATLILVCVAVGKLVSEAWLGSGEGKWPAVERAPRFYIYGEVQRAGTYRLERNMTVMQGLSVGGGLTQRGTERGLRIQRRDAEGNLQILTVNSSDWVQPDDVIYIKESLF